MVGKSPIGGGGGSTGRYRGNLKVMGYQNSTQPSKGPSYVGDGSVNTAMGETARDEKKKTPAWKEYFNRMGGFMGPRPLAGLLGPDLGPWGSVGSGIVSAIAALRKPKEK